jgi:hypothetical protein
MAPLLLFERGWGSLVGKDDMVGMRSMRRIGRAYVRPVERFTPARKAETMRVVSFADRFGEEFSEERNRLTEHSIKRDVSDTTELEQK